MAVKLWKSVAIAMESALGANLTLSAITKANPGVATSTAHGLTNGSYVKLAVQGMSQVNGRVFRVANVTANTFELEGENTTSYDTFSSGTANLITYGTTMTTAVGMTGSGGTFEFIDTTTIHDSVRSQIPGPASAAEYTFENFWDLTDAALVAMKAASDTQAQKAFRFTFADGAKMVFNGYVGATLLPKGNAQEKVTTDVSVTMFGKPTYYAT